MKAKIIILDHDLSIRCAAGLPRSDRDLRQSGNNARYGRQLVRVLRARWREPHILFIYAIKIAMHNHYAALTRALAQVETGSPNAGRSFSRVRRRRDGESAAAA
jgi:hypothetical protein